jgi:hypothetical protein
MFESWDEAELDLRVDATLALDGGASPPPTLLAFAERRPVGAVRLRPAGEDELLQALVEVLSLLLPLGARRLALTLPGQVREVAEPSELDQAVGDAPLVVLATADGLADRPAKLTARVLPLRHDGTCWQWWEDGEVELDASAWDVSRALGVLLDAPVEELGPGTHERRELQAQLARCLLLGHGVTLAPDAADRLEPERDEVAGARLAPGG